MLNHMPVLPWLVAAVVGADASSPYLEEDLPEIGTLMDRAFPMWEIDADGNRVQWKPCTVESCEWNPFYVTKRYDGLHPDYGGHPTSNDIKYVFHASCRFLGQPYGGGNHHCALDAPDDVKMSECPKLETLTDTGPDGPGQVSPHIALASLTWGVQDKLLPIRDMFDYDSYQCRVTPDVLLAFVRNYYPRTDGEAVFYPKPYTPEGGDFQYEFPSGNGLANQGPPYAPASPHWCTEEFLATGHWTGACPYVFEGPDAGKYRHPHIAYAALEVYLANIVMPDRCAVTWLQNNPEFLDPDRIDTHMAFPAMSNDSLDNKTVGHWIGQPVLPWTYDPGDAKDAEVMLANVTRAGMFFNVTLDNSDGPQGAVASGAGAALGVAAALIGPAICLACM